MHEILDRTTQGAGGHGASRGERAADSGDANSGAHGSRGASRAGVRCEPGAGHASREGRENLLASKYIRYGSSPRGAQTLILGGKVRALLDGRYNVSLEDIRALMLPALRHRIILNFEAQADGRTPDDLLEEIAGKISVEVGRCSAGFSLWRSVFADERNTTG